MGVSVHILCLMTGEFRDNKPNGMGMLKTQDGASYIGMWIDGSKHGQGRYRWASGKVYEGQWENGLQHGHGKLYSPPDPKSGGGHVGTSGVVGELIYEGMFYKGMLAATCRSISFVYLHSKIAMFTFSIF